MNYITVDLLKKTYSLGVITNGNADLEMIGIEEYFDYILSPVELNAHKPDPKMFLAVLEETIKRDISHLATGFPFKKPCI